MRHFLLARELPALFALCLVGAAFAFENQQSALAVWLLFAALWTFLLWLILLPARPKHATSTQPDHHEPRGNQERCRKQRGRAA